MALKSHPGCRSKGVNEFCIYATNVQGNKIRFNRIDWVEGTLKMILFQTICHGKGNLPLGVYLFPVSMK